jgi:hypothetical protein
VHPAALRNHRGQPVIVQHRRIGLCCCRLEDSQGISWEVGLSDLKILCTIPRYDYLVGNNQN